MELSFLEKAFPSGIQAISLGTLKQVIAKNGDLCHIVEVPPREEYRLETAFYDTASATWWARHPSYPKVALITWQGDPPQNMPKKILRRLTSDTA